MKLYDVAHSEGGTWIRILESAEGPPSSPDFRVDDVVLFYRIDGSYSVCRNRGGELVYLKAWAEVELVGKGET